MSAEEDYKTLEQLLEDARLPHWYPVLVDWLDRFDGWRAQYLADESARPDFEPLGEVIDVLVHLPPQERASDEALAARLARLDCYRWRASGFGARIDNWHPMVEPFRDFVARGPTHTTILDRPFQPPTVIEHWLLGRAFKALRTRGNG